MKMTRAELTCYHQYRQDGNSAKNSLRCIRESRRSITPNLKWIELDISCTMYEAQIRRPNPDNASVFIRIKVSDDHDPDLSFLGEVQGEEFEPSITYEEHCRDLRDLNYSKSESDRLAREYVARDREMLLSILKCDGDWLCTVVTAIAFVNNIERARNSIGGVIFQPHLRDGWKYVNETAWPLAVETEQQALEELNKLCGKCNGSGRRNAE